MFRFILKLVLGLFAAIFALSFLAAALVVLTLSVLKSLITGRKPAPAMLFEQFQQFRSQRVWTASAPRPSAAGPQSGQIVDVEAREIREDKRLS
jgi:hypothetical protein